MPTKLTIVIPFLNEGDEVANTVASIKATAVTDPCITLINDASTDGYDYKSVAEKYGCRYVHNAERLGVAESRNKGVRESQTPYFLLLDGHMRFYEHGWDERLVKLLDENPRSVLCGQTKRLGKNIADEVVAQKNDKKVFGAFMNMALQDGLGVKWNNIDIATYSNLIEVPCILGAAYACSKAYWERIHGLNCLIFYGLDEQLLSIKVWREGGRCLLVKDWEVGHLYRDNFPYEVPNEGFAYNRLFILELLFPYSIKKDFFACFRLMAGVGFEKAYALLRTRYVDVKAEKNYLNSIFQHDIDCFLTINRKVVMANGAQR